MIFDIKGEKSENIPNFKGGEKFFSAKMHYDGMNRFLHGTLIPGATIGEHLHDTSSEIIYFLSGKGSVLYDGERFEVEAGQCHYCPNGQPFYNLLKLINSISSLKSESAAQAEIT